MLYDRTADIYMLEFGIDSDVIKKQFGKQILIFYQKNIKYF